MSATGYFRLFRISVAFTPAADVVLGYALARPQIGTPLCSPMGLVAACLSSSLVFCATVALNDAIDKKKDSREAPRRPIPSGAVSIRGAFIAAGATAAAALAIAAALGTPVLFALSGVLLLTVLYNTITRRQRWLGVVNLGLIRVADVCFGMVCAAGFGTFSGATPRAAAVDTIPTHDLWVVPAMYGLYAIALSGVALGERERSPAPPATIAFSSLAAATALYFAFRALTFGAGGSAGAPWWQTAVLLLLLILPLLRLLAGRQKEVEPIVGHLVSGYLLLAAMPVAAFLSPAAGWVLAGLFVISRFLGRVFPPA